MLQVVESNSRRLECRKHQYYRQFAWDRGTSGNDILHIFKGFVTDGHSINWSRVQRFVKICRIQTMHQVGEENN